MAIRLDHRIIVDIVQPGTSVLDLGCGTGELLALLQREKKIKAQGIEIDHDAIYQCVAKGLSVIHGDLDTGLTDYGDGLFDYVILNQTMQQLKNPSGVLTEALRKGKKVIVGFPNFAYYTSRLQMFFAGRAPVTPSLPFEWYDTPNSHFLSIRDFSDFCRKQGLKVERTFFISNNQRVRWWPNLLAQSGIFVLT